MALFHKLHTTSYWSAVVSLALSCTIFQLFDVEVSMFICAFVYYLCICRNLEGSLKVIGNDTIQ